MLCVHKYVSVFVRVCLFVSIDICVCVYIYIHKPEMSNVYTVRTYFLNTVY